MADKRRERAVTALPTKNIALYDAFFNLPKVDLHNPEEVRQRTDEYRNYVNQTGIAPLWTDYAFCLGYSRQHLFDMRTGRTGERYPKETREIIERVHIWLEATLAQVGMENPQKSIMTIWLQKNCFGYSDRLEVAPTQPRNDLFEEDSAEDVIRRYALASIPDTPELPGEERETADFFLKAPESTETPL